MVFYNLAINLYIFINLFMYYVFKKLSYEKIMDLLRKRNYIYQTMILFLNQKNLYYSLKM